MCSGELLSPPQPQPVSPPQTQLMPPPQPSPWDGCHPAPAQPQELQPGQAGIPRNQAGTNRSSNQQWGHGSCPIHPSSSCPGAGSPGAAPPLGKNPAAPAIEECTSSSSRTAEQLNTTRCCSQSLVTLQHLMASPTAPLGGSRASPWWED